ncbi:ATP-binding protein [bacterium]|nr:ATP-binding protein [bacterium]
MNHEQTVKKYNGILLGKDFHDQALFLNQDEYLTRNNNDINGINLILAKSGAGKSILLKKIIYLSSLIKKQKIIILDVENEYSFLVKSFHNSLMIDLLPLELDPFKLEFNTNNEKIIFLASFLNCLCNHDFTNELSQYFKKVNIHGF